jgi:hypothetical protein
VDAPHWPGKCSAATPLIAPPILNCPCSPLLARQPQPTLSRTGGCTFPENPGQSCAHVLPVWSAAVDPCVLAVRAGGPAREKARLFDASALDARVLRRRDAEHIMVRRDNDIFRLDVIEGTVGAGPVSLRFDLANDDRLSVQISAIKRFMGKPVTKLGHAQLASRLRALHAVDARDAGASLREVAELVLGPGVWPGDGEHRKSLARRLIIVGDNMVRAGPAGAVFDRPNARGSATHRERDVQSPRSRR